MTKISKNNYFINSKDINKKILLLTDIHYYQKKDMKKLNNVLNSIKNESFDYICIVGDFIDIGSIKDMDLYIDWLNELAKIKKVFISLGGHDIIKAKGKYEYYYNKEFFDKLKKINNLYLLDNDIYEEDGIRFIGLTLPLDYYYKYKENTNYFMRYVNNTFDTFDDSKYNILLCHTPVPITNIVNYNDVKLLNNIQLILCGHTHAGIVPKFMRKIMRGRGIFSPNSNKMFPKNTYGLVKRYNTDIVISSGITKASHTNRFSFLDGLFDKELTFIEIGNKK